MQNITLKLPLRDTAEMSDGTMTVGFKAGKQLVRQFFPAMVKDDPLQPDRNGRIDFAQERDDDHITDAEASSSKPLRRRVGGWGGGQGRTVTIRIPCDDSETVEVTISPVQ